MTEILHGSKLFYNDQDVLNILFHDHVRLIDISWNYTNNIEAAAKPDVKAITEPFRREDFNIVHFIGRNKPWNAEVPLAELYHKYNQYLKGVLNNYAKK